MKELPPNIVVRGNDPIGREDLTEEILNRREGDLVHLNPSERARIHSNEYPKTQDEIKMLADINQAINVLRQECGFGPVFFPPEKCYILPKSILEEFLDSRGGGVASYEEQLIALDANVVRSHRIVFANVAFHEVLHLSGAQVFRSLETSGSPESNLGDSLYRAGWTVYSSPKKGAEGDEHSHFKGLHEAIVANEEFKFTRNLMDREEFSDLKERMSSLDIMEIKLRIYQDKGVAIDEIFYIDEAREEYYGVGYPKQREVLLYVCDVLAEDVDCKSEDIEKEFLKGHFSGDLFPIARMMKESFGSVGFRALGGMDTKGNSAINTFEMLKTLRQNVIRERRKKEKA